MLLLSFSTFMVALPFSVVYFSSLLFSKRHRYLHYTVPALAVVGYLLYPRVFYMVDDGHDTDLFWPVMFLLSLTFGMYYVRNRYLYNTMLVVNFLLNLLVLMVTAILVYYIVLTVG